MNVTDGITVTSYSGNVADSAPYVSVVPEPPHYVIVYVSAVYAILFTLGALGNALVVAVVCRQTDMRTTTNCFIVNLSIADILVIAVSVLVAVGEAIEVGEVIEVSDVISISDFIVFNDKVSVSDIAILL